jgi:hypothetical protein
VLAEHMRAGGEHARFLRRVRWAYTRDDDGKPFERTHDARATKKRGRGPNAGKYTTKDARRRDTMLAADVCRLTRLKLSVRTREEMEKYDFASAPVVSPRNEVKHAIIEQRVLEYGQVKGERVMRWRAKDYVKTGAQKTNKKGKPIGKIPVDSENDPTVHEVFEAYGPGCGARAVAAVANYYGMKDQKAKASDADQRRSVKVPLVFWYAQGLPMVLNHNRYTHCGWTNGSTGRASNIVLDPREPPDDGEGDFRELQYEVRRHAGGWDGALVHFLVPICSPGT